MVYKKLEPLLLEFLFSSLSSLSTIYSTSLFHIISNFVLSERIIPEGVQDQVGWRAGQPHLVPDIVIGNIVYGSGVGTRYFLRSFPKKAIL